jgi:hypothetical protein
MMRRFEMEARAPMPPDFDAWLHELGLIGDCEGAWALVGFLWHSNREHCAYLATLPGVWPGLLARAQYADRCRFAVGIWSGRQKTGTE